MNCELSDVQYGLRKGRGTRDQIANICWNIKKAREFQKSIYFCLIDYAKAFDYVDHNNFQKIVEEIGILDHLIHLLRKGSYDQPREHIKKQRRHFANKGPSSQG